MNIGGLHLSWSALDHVQAILTLVISIVAVTGLLAGARFALAQRNLYKELLESEAAIRKKQDEIDAVEPDINRRTSGFNVNENQRLRQIEVARAPLLRELERLREERDFIKDRLVFSNRKRP